MSDYSNWNENPELWNSIERVIKATSLVLTKDWKLEDFKNFFLTKICYYDTETDSFVIEGSFDLNTNIQYIEDRNGKNQKKWTKIKQEIENNFRTIFEKFEVPERSFKPVLNPLLNRTVESKAQMSNYETKILPFDEIAKIFSLENNDIYSNRLAFQFSIKASDSSFKLPVATGVNEIEDTNVLTIKTNIKVLIKSPMDYCRYVLSLSPQDSIAEILIYNYLELQLKAYLGYNYYPNKVINKISSERFFFDSEVDNFQKDFTLVLNNNTYTISGSQLSYNQYILEAKKLYNPTKKQLIGELYQLDSIRNKIILFDYITKQLIYTDDFAQIKRLDLSNAEPISYLYILTILNKPFKGTNGEWLEPWLSFFKTLKAIYNRIDKTDKLDFDSVFNEELTFGSFIEKDISVFPKIYQILNDCYNAWDSVNYDILAKCRYKALMSILLFERSGWDIPEEDLNLNLASIYLTGKKDRLPTSLISLLKTNHRNSLYNFNKLFRDQFFIEDIAIKITNNKIRKPAVVTYDDLAFYNRLQMISNGNMNGIVINFDTIRSLYKEFGKNLINYFNSLPINTIFILHPNIFFESEIFGSTDLYQANKLSLRPLIIEVLKAIGFDYVIYYKEQSSVDNDFVDSCLRKLFYKVKYRTIYGNDLDENDAILLDPNLVDSKVNIFTELNNYSSYCPEIDINTYTVEITKSQEEFYKQLVNLSYEKMKINKDFQQAILLGNLDDPIEFKKFMSNYLSQADIFLNAPDSNLFSFKDKFEAEDNINLLSGKLDLIYSIISSQLYGGLVEGKRKESKNSNILIVCENRLVLDHLYKNLSYRFFGDVCYKFNIANPTELKEFLNKRVGFITIDLLRNKPAISNVSNLVLVQNSWDKSDLIDLYDYARYISIERLIKESIEINQIFFNKTLEINKFEQELANYIKTVLNNKTFKKFNLNAKYFLANLPDPILDLDNLEFSNIYTTAKYRLIEKFKQIQGQMKKFSDSIMNNQLQAIVSKIHIQLSEEDMYDIIFSSIRNLEAPNGIRIYKPFINNMYLDFHNVVPLLIDEYFSDINGNLYQYINGTLTSNIPVYTQYGSGKVISESGSNYIIDIYSLGERIVPKNLVYVPIKDHFEDFMEYIKLIQAYGDSKFDKTLEAPQKIQLKDEDSNLTPPDNSVDLKIDRINGLFSLYTNAIDSDNYRLEDFDFRKFSNIYTIEINNEEIFKGVENALKRLDFNDKYIDVLNSAYKEFKLGKEFKLSPLFNYFACNQIKEEKPTIYVMVWQKKFYALLNGNFYSKIGYKLSKKFNVSLITSLYVQQFDTVKSCKYEVMKISKTLDIINYQEILDFLNQDFETLDILEVADKHEEMSEEEKKDRLIDILKTKEKKLKEHIKKVRMEKYGK